MKRWSLVFPALLAALLCSLPAYADITVSRSVAGTGGDRATNAGYSVTGTAGQPGIGVVTGPSNINEAGFWYQLAADGAGVEERDRGAPTRYWLGQNRPNPFSPSTVLQFTLPRTSHVAIRLYDARGREVTTMVDEELPPGCHTKVFKATGLPSGVYFCRMQAEGFVQTRKMVLLK
jgi:hypothetical protein